MAGACKTYPTERLSAFVDGDLPPAEAAALRAHAAGCAACTAAIAELRGLVANARALGAPEPPVTLWASIEGELERRDRFAWLKISLWRPLGIGALAGAVAVVVVLAALPALRLHEAGNGQPAAPPGAEVVATAAAASADPLLHEAEAEFAQAAAAYERSIGKLRSLLAREEARWSPEERSRMAERLARLDDAIARSRELARRTPGDSAGNEQLFAAYQQKIAFLAAAVHRGGEAGEWDKPGGGRQ
jgi:hypothetical protein